MIFIGSPYYHPDLDVCRERAKICSKYAGYLLNKGLIPISPVVFGAKVLDYCNIPSDFSYWGKLSLEYLKRSTELHVLTLDGWKESNGVKAEIAFARQNKIHVRHINVDLDAKPLHFFEDLKLKRTEGLINKIKNTKS